MLRGVKKGVFIILGEATKSPYIIFTPKIKAVLKYESQF